MAKILILGGGFGGVVASQRLAENLGDEHQITMVARSRSFVFYPALVRLAFGKCSRDDVSFDLRGTMLNRKVNFIEAEVARIDPEERKVIIAHGEVEGNLSYDYLIFALGRRLATEKVSGHYENSHHLLNVDKALKFGHAIATFNRGHAIIGQCPRARLPVPVYETAFALSRLLSERGKRDQVKITIISPDPPGRCSRSEPAAHYSHEMRTVIDEGGSDSVYQHKDIWTSEPAEVRQGRFWSWAKRVREKYLGICPSLVRAWLAAMRKVTHELREHPHEPTTFCHISEEITVIVKEWLLLSPILAWRVSVGRGQYRNAVASGRSW